MSLNTITFQGMGMSLNIEDMQLNHRFRCTIDNLFMEISLIEVHEFHHKSIIDSIGIGNYFIDIIIEKGKNHDVPVELRSLMYKEHKFTKDNLMRLINKVFGSNYKDIKILD